jgi:DNA-binding response OmpR family regulator
MVLVLIMEDDELLRSHLCDGLAAAGHDVKEAKDGKSGLDLFQSMLPDIVLTDLIMENGEGIESIMAIRRQAPTVPVIAMSGNPQYLKNSSKLGATHTLLKPFRMTQLLEVFDEALNAET